MNKLVAASASVGWTNTLFSRHSTLNVGLPAATCTTGSPTSMTVRWFNAVFRCTMRVRSLVWVSIFCATAGTNTAASTANINTTRLMACSFLPLVRMLYVQETSEGVSWTYNIRTKGRNEQAMRRVVLMFAVLAAVFVPAVAQKIETETSDRTRIVHLKTALNHLTVIEVGEPVVQVAAGSPTFKVEWRENKVFVQPTEADAATNLFIWTASQRLNYELEPAASVETMDFAVDQAPVHLEPVKPTASTAPAAVSPSITELLLAGKPIRRLPSKQRASKPVEVWISDLYEKDGRLLVRYTVCNHGTEPYAIDTPLVYQLDL